MIKYDCILLAAGEGQRAALGYNKVLYKIGSKKEIVRYSLEYFINDEQCEKIVLVINERDKYYFENLLKEYESKKIEYTYGGANRGDSVYQGLKLTDGDYVIVHDSARPLVYKEDVYNLLNNATETGGATLATKVYNTTCHMIDGYVDEYFSRHTLASLITPQCFKASTLLKAYHKARVEGINYTDDTGIFKAYGGNVRLVFTDNVSIKATTAYDIKFLEAILDASR
mgnify:CR=1 FL=1